MLFEPGRRFRPRGVAPYHRHVIVADMFVLLERLLHGNCSIFHGDIRESNFVWNADGRLRPVNFRSGRFADEPHGEWNSSFASDMYFTMDRMKKRDEIHGGAGYAGVVPAPTVFGDFALTVAVWSM